MLTMPSSLGRNVSVKRAIRIIATRAPSRNEHGRTIILDALGACAGKAGARPASPRLTQWEREGGSTSLATYFLAAVGHIRGRQPPKKNEGYYSGRAGAS